MMTNQSNTSYYVPNSSYWPVVGCVGLFTLFLGAAHWLHYRWYGPYVFFLGFSIVLFMMYGWFGTVIHENKQGLYGQQTDRSFRWGMTWFIVSEVFFFACLFGALFFTRLWVLPQLAGDVVPITHILLWPDFLADWPLLTNPDNSKFEGAQGVSNTWGIPALNTLILLSSGVSITVAHWALQNDRRRMLIGNLAITVAFGIAFLVCQGNEYYHAYTVDGLTLNAGVYGSLFFILTGFHGTHVTIGTVMLIVILGRCIAGHFSPENHFALQAAAWYWHFVDAVWLLLFVFVYWY